MHSLAIVLVCSLWPQSAPEPVSYYLPFAYGKRIVVYRGNGEGSHADVFNRYAFDFTVPIGTPVHASASGKVVFVKQDTAGPTGNWRDNNEVAIHKAPAAHQKDLVRHHLGQQQD